MLFSLCGDATRLYVDVYTPVLAGKERYYTLGTRVQQLHKRLGPRYSDSKSDWDPRIAT